MDNVSGALNFKATIENKDFKREVDEMEAKIKGMTGVVQTESRKMDTVFKNLLAGAASVFTVGAAMQFRKKLIEVRGEFQKYQAVLTNSLGSAEQAAESMQMLADFASTTPFELNKLTAAYVKLVNQGFKPSVEEMRALGDLASSTGKDFEQLAEAILDAQTGEFERLKEFGVKASVSGNQITFAFKGVKTAVDNSAEAIRNYVLSLGDTQGVAGAMASISSTLVGQVSNLQDSITQMFNEIGQKSEGFLSGSIELTKSLIENYEKIGKALAVLITTYGAYKAAVVTVNVVQNVAAAASKGYTIAMQLQYKWLLLVEKAQKLLNATMLSNPWVLLATVIAGVISYLVIFKKRQSDITEGQKEFNKIFAQGVGEVSALFDQLKKTNTGTDERRRVIEQINSKYGEYLGNLNLEKATLEEILKTEKLVTDAMMERLAAEGKTKDLASIAEERFETLRKIQSKVTPEDYEAIVKAIADGVDLLKTSKIGDITIWPTLTNQDAQNTFGQIGTLIAKVQNLDKQTEQVNDTWDKFIQGIRDASEAPVEPITPPETFTFYELQLKYERDLTTLKQKRLALVESKQEYPENEYLQQLQAIDDQIAEITKKQKLLTAGAGDAGIDADKLTFDQLIAYKKEQYEKYYTWVQAFGVESAKTEYAALMTEGSSYSEYLKRQIDILQARKANLTTKELANLQLLQEAYAEQIAIENQQETERKKREQQQEQDITEALLQQYAGYLSDKLKFETTYLANKKRLTLAVEKATTAEELAIAMEALDQLEAKRQEYANITGDIEYDNLLKQYQDYEDKRQAIIDEFSAKRQKAAENNNLELFNKLVDAEKEALSKLSSEELMSSDAWMTLFERLDQISVKELLKLKHTIEEQFKTLDLTPADLEALRNRLDETTDQILKKNPFKALKEALQDYKKAEGKEDLASTFEAVGASIDMINEMFQSVIGSLEKMGVEMDDVTRGILDDISGILDGASQLAMGIATGNPLQIVQGSLDLIASGIDLIWGTKDRKILRSIDQHQEVVDDLERAYNRLQNAIDDALGTDVFALQMQAINNLREQNDELNEMAKDEESRKKADEDKLDEYRDQIYQNQQMINDFQAQIAEQITQTTAKTAADQLMDALVGAWEAGEDAAKAWGETVEEIMKNAVVNAVKMQVIEKLVNKAIDNLMTYMGHWEGQNFVFDGLSQQEQDMIRQQFMAIYDTMKEMAPWLEDMFKSMGIDVTGGGGLTGAIKGVSEETATLIAGQMNAMRLNQVQSLDLLRQQLISLSGIKENTDVLPESLIQLRTIASNTTGAMSLFSGTGIKVYF